MIPSFVTDRMFGERIGLPQNLVYNLIYLFDPESAYIASKIDLDLKKDKLEDFLKKYDLEISEETLDVNGFSPITIKDSFDIADIEFKQSQRLYDFYSKNKEEISMFSLSQDYNISVENDKLMILSPKKEYKAELHPVVKKYVMMKPLHTSNFEVLEEYKNIKDENSYDFLCMLAKEAPEDSNIGHFVVMIVRKRNNEIKINLLDSLREEHRHDLELPIQDAFENFFRTNKNDNIKYVNNYCGPQRTVDWSNCGFYAFKFIYNYLFLSYNNEDTDCIIKSICTGRDADPFLVLWYNRMKTIYEAPANTIVDNTKRFFDCESPTETTIRNFYFLRDEERNFILKLIDVKFNG